MSEFMLVIIVAIVGGLAQTLQAQVVGLIDKQIGTMTAVAISSISGAVVIIAIGLLSGGIQIAAWRSVPWYAYTAGLLGLVIVGSLGFTVQRVGLVTAFTVFVAAQLLSGALIDHFGLLGALGRPLDWSRLAGSACLLVGVWLVLR